MRYSACAVTITLILLVTGDRLPSAVAEDITEQQRLFERVFGGLADWDPGMIHRVKEGKTGERHHVDRDDDGQPDEVWFIDTHREHLPQHRPLMVRAIDEDGDLRWGDEPDRDSDLYLADWQSDGQIDAALDYVDHDGDQDVDEMANFFYLGRVGGRAALRVWWSRDDGDDNLLWHTLGYRYYQRPSQHHTHFGGDESFCSLNLFEDADSWTPLHEMPFLFYDNDEDGVSEEVIRVTGFDQRIETLRWSFDADNDATLENPRDYDASISAFAPGFDPERGSSSDFTLDLDARFGEPLTIRGIPTRPILRRPVAQAFLRPVRWGRVAMTWVENDHNVGWQRDYQQERWEGVIVHRSENMPSIGGPSADPFNNRNEIWLNPDGPNRFYYSPADQRIHLRHADQAWIDVDYDGDATADMRYEFIDDDGDGLLEIMTLDIDHDGQPEDRWRISVDSVQPLTWQWRDMHGLYASRLGEQAKALYVLNQTLLASLRAQNRVVRPDAVWRLLENNFTGSSWSDAVARKFVHSPVALVFYLKLARDRMIVDLKTAAPDANDFWTEFNQARAEGDAGEMTLLLRNQFSPAEPAEAYADWIAARQSEPSRRRVAWSRSLAEETVAWENQRIGYRLCDGQFDFFGKREPTLILPRIEQGQREWDTENEQDWGRDALRVGETPGCGGLILYVNGERYPVGADNANQAVELVSIEDDSVTFEVKVEGVGPEPAPYTVVIRPTLRSGDLHTTVQVRIEGGRSEDELALGLGLTRLSQESLLIDGSAGALGLWGVQDASVGWIGTGLLYPPRRYQSLLETEDHYELRLDVEPGKPTRYAVMCEWARGRRFPYAPAAKDWLDRLREAASQLDWD